MQNPGLLETPVAVLDSNHPLKFPGVPIEKLIRVESDTEANKLAGATYDRGRGNEQNQLGSHAAGGLTFLGSGARTFDHLGPQALPGSNQAEFERFDHVGSQNSSGSGRQGR